MTFDDAFAVVIGNEGGYSNDPNDPGGETKFGISKRAYPGLDIANLTLERARGIYRHDYWDKVSGDLLPYRVALQVFDFAVNGGTDAAIRTLQKTLGVDVDGQLGPVTLKAAAADPGRVAVLFCAQRLRFYTSTKLFPVFGRGWVNRVATLLEQA